MFSFGLLSGIYSVISKHFISTVQIWEQCEQNEYHIHDKIEKYDAYQKEMFT